MRKLLAAFYLDKRKRGLEWPSKNVQNTNIGLGQFKPSD